MNKKDIIFILCKNAGITVSQAEKAYHSFLTAMIHSLKEGERVTFSGFGSFEIKQRRARSGRNPKTGQSIDIPPKKRVKFNPSRMLKDQL